MDIQAFVRETLRQIITGVTEARNDSGQGIVNPRTVQYPASKPIPVESRSLIKEIEFDIAVTVEEHKNRSTEAEAGAGGLLKVVSTLKAGGKLESSSANISVSRVKFSVPVQFPTGN